MKPDKHILASAGIVLAIAGLIALTWYGTIAAIDAQRQELTARVTATLSNQALTFSEQINRQILAFDQTLRILATQWQNNPNGFDLEAWRRQATVLNGLSRDMVLTDENGVIRQSSVNEAINQNASGLDYFRALADPTDQGDRPAGTPIDQMYIGPAAIDGIMRQWHMNVARALHYPDGSFAGVIDADYRIAAITDVFSQTNLGAGAFLSLAGLDDGKLRGVVGPSLADPDAGIGDTAMFAAIRETNSGLWTGPSAADAVQRIHAFRHIPGRQLSVVVAMNEDEAMHPADEWAVEAQVFASCITVLLTGLAWLLISGTWRARRRAAVMTEERAILASSNAQLDVARALAADKTEQLETTLAGMNDGVSIVDAHMCLVEWNARFPVIAGVPAEILRVGLPMEEILRVQIRTGQFGAVSDPNAEVTRHMLEMQSTRFATVQRQRPDGHMIELRRNRLPEGGFVALYADITEQKQTEDALRRARAATETATAGRSRMVGILSHGLRPAVASLLNAMQSLDDGARLVTRARQAADLLNDSLDLAQIEDSTVSIEPDLFALRPLLEDCATAFAGQAAERGMTLHLDVADSTPEMLITDCSRLRQVLSTLLSIAVKRGRPGAIRLTAEPGETPNAAIRLTVRDNGPVIAPDVREILFRPFSWPESPNGAEADGLSLSIGRHLMILMGGQIGCDPWHDKTGRDGNSFWIALPAGAVVEPARPNPPAPEPEPAMDQSEPADRPARIADLPERGIPRTRVLLAGANEPAIATLLRREGHYVDCAASGQAMIVAVKTTPYDLVFMDFSLTDMSGPDAARLIRAWPGPTRAMPIVAFASPISARDEALCKVAGMNGIIDTNLSPSDLIASLRTYVWSGSPDADDSAGTMDEADAAATHNKALVLARSQMEALRAKLPPPTFANLIEEGLLDLENRLPALRRALTAGAPAAVSAHANAMAGMAESYGLTALEVRLRAIMAAATTNELPALGPSVVTDLEADFNAANQALRRLLERREGRETAS